MNLTQEVNLLLKELGKVVNTATEEDLDIAYHELAIVRVRLKNLPRILVKFGKAIKELKRFR